MILPLLTNLFATYYRLEARASAGIAPFAALALRFWLAEIFFRAGVLKALDWSATLDLFRYVYQVPLLPPPMAAAAGMLGEIAFPLLLVLGLGGRLAALGLFGMNIVACVSFPDLSDLGRQDHVLWGLGFAVLAIAGPGRWSFDQFIRGRLTISDKEQALL